MWPPRASSKKNRSGQKRNKFLLWRNYKSSQEGISAMIENNLNISNSSVEFSESYQIVLTDKQTDRQMTTASAVLNQRYHFGQLVSCSMHKKSSTFLSFLPKLRPLVPFSTATHEIPLGPLPPVRHITILMSVSPPPLIKAYTYINCALKTTGIYETQTYEPCLRLGSNHHHLSVLKWSKKRRHSRFPVQSGSRKRYCPL